MESVFHLYFELDNHCLDPKLDSKYAFYPSETTCNQILYSVYYNIIFSSMKRIQMLYINFIVVGIRDFNFSIEIQNCAYFF